MNKCHGKISILTQACILHKILTQHINAVYYRALNEYINAVMHECLHAALKEWAFKQTYYSTHPQKFRVSTLASRYRSLQHIFLYQSATHSPAISFTSDFIHQFTSMQSHSVLSPAYNATRRQCPTVGSNVVFTAPRRWNRSKLYHQQHAPAISTASLQQITASLMKRRYKSWTPTCECSTAPTHQIVFNAI